MSEVKENPIKVFFLRFYDLFWEVDIANRAAQVAFFFLFAIFPLLYLLVSLFGLLLESSENLKTELFEYFRQIMPYSVFDLVRTTIEEIVERSTGGRVTLGLIITVWTASVGLDAIRDALNAILKLTERRPYYWLKLHSLVLTVILTLLTGIALVIVFYGWQIFGVAFKSIGFGNPSPFLLVGLQWTAIVLVAILLFEIFYNLLPDHRRFRWVWVTPGSIVAVLLWMLLTGGFRLYLSFFDQYSRAYGSLGAVMLLLLWLYLTSIAIMVGAAINAILAEMRIVDPESVGAEQTVPEDVAS